MTEPDNRTVHARLQYGEEIVRYDKAGKWYVESRLVRRPLTLAEAIELITWGDRVFWGRPGGRQFDAGVRRYFLSIYGEVPA